MIAQFFMILFGWGWDMDPLDPPLVGPNKDDYFLFTYGLHVFLAARLNQSRYAKLGSFCCFKKFVRIKRM